MKRASLVIIDNNRLIVIEVQVHFLNLNIFAVGFENAPKSEYFQ